MSFVGFYPIFTARDWKEKKRKLDEWEKVHGKME